MGTLRGGAIKYTIYNCGPQRLRHRSRLHKESSSHYWVYVCLTPEPMSFHDSILPLQGNSTQPLQAHPAVSTASFRSPGIRHIDSSSLELFTSALLLGPPLLHRNTHSQNIFTFTFVTFSFSLAQPSQNISSPSTSSFLYSILSSTFLKEQNQPRQWQNVRMVLMRALLC